MPLIRSLNYVKYWSKLRVPNPYNLDLNSKEGKSTHCLFIQPTNRSQMFIEKPSCQPNNYSCFKTGKVSKDLPQVLQIRPFKLILDNHQVVGLRNAGHNVGPIRANELLGVF